MGDMDSAVGTAVGGAISLMAAGMVLEGTRRMLKGDKMARKRARRAGRSRKRAAKRRSTKRRTRRKTSRRRRRK